MTLFNSATQLMAQYARYHRDRRNIATHLVGVPLIFFSIGVLLSHPVGATMRMDIGTVAGHTLTWAWLAWGLTSLWYLSRGSLLLGLATTLVNAGLIALAHQAPSFAQAQGWASWAFALAVFAVGWVFQFVGHYWEGRKPAFVDDVVGLLVGPMFVVGEFLMGLGLLRQMRMDIERQAGATH